MTRIEPNPAQKLAIQHRDGPLFISAGAGSGKTRVLVERVIDALLADEAPVDPRQVLSITFTRKAAQELLDRVVRALEDRGRSDLSRRVGEMWISTIHGAAARLLKEQALVIGLDPGFVQIDEVTTARMREQALEETLDHFADATGTMRALLDQYPDIENLMPAVIELSRSLAQGDDILHAVVPQEPDTLLRDTSERIDELVAQLERLMCDPDEKPCSYTKRFLEASLVEVGAALAKLRFTGDAEADEVVADQAIAAAAKYLDKNLTRVEYLGRDTHLAARASLGALQSGLLAIKALPSALALEEFAREWHRRMSVIKAEASALDYDDLLIQARDALRDHPSVAAEYEGRFLLAQIDEFQDTNELQRDFVKRLAGSALATVGDAQQSIYAFQGADIEVYRRHGREMDARGALRVELEHNYRSHPEILDLANHLFGGEDPALGSDFLPLRSGLLEGEPQRPAPGGGPSLEFVAVTKAGKCGADEVQPTRSVSAQEFASRVKALIDAGESPGDIVALVPSRTQVKHYVAALAERGIEAASTGGEYYRTPPVKLAGALVRVLANARDEASLVALLASDVFGASDDDLVAISRDACTGDPGRIAIDELLEESIGESAPLEGGACLAPEERLAALPAPIAHARRVLVDARAAVHEASLAFVIRTAIDRSGWIGRLQTRGEQGRVDIAALLQFVRVVERFEREGGSGLHDLLRTLAALEEHATDVGAPMLPSLGEGVVRFMTIHGAKGLEFKHVFLLEAQHWRDQSDVIVSRDRPGEKVIAYKRSDDLWRDPSFDSDEGAEVLPSYPALRRGKEVAAREEKLHVLYVALTRAEETLTVIGEVSGEVAPYDPVASSHPMIDLMLDRLLPYGPLEPGAVDVALPGSVSGASIRVTVVGVEPAPKSGRVQEDGSEASEGDASGGQEPYGQPSGATEPVRPTPLVRTDPVPQRISYSGIAAYHACGRRFLYERIVRVGRLSLDDGSSSALDFGSAFHALAELAGRHGGDFARTRIDAIADVFGVPRERTEDLQRALDAWCASALAKRAGEAQRVGYETPFTLAIQGEGIPTFDLDGSIDLYARTGDRTLIVDYKSGGDASGADDPAVTEELSARYRLQASCYALAAIRDGSASVEVVFVRPEVVTAAGEVQTVTFTFDAGDAAGLEAELIETYRRMVAQEWEPRATYSSEECLDCPVAGTICPVGAPALVARRTQRAVG